MSDHIPARRRRRWPRVLAVLVLLVALALGGAYVYARPLLLTGTGYAAHNACAVFEVSGRDSVDEDLPPNPLVPYLSSRIDGSSVRTSVFGLLAAQRAHFHSDYYGCTITDSPIKLPEATQVLDPHPLITAPAPPPQGAIEAAIDVAFGTDLTSDEQATLGTRAVVVVKDGQIIGERYADGFTAEMPQLGWSMAKSATNLLAGILVKEGALDLHQSGLMGWTDERRGITVDHLLRMTSGLAWDETYDLGTPITSMLYLADDMGRFAAGQPLAHPVGRVQQYSSGSTNIACSVFDDITGEGANLPRRALFKPLGLTTAVWEPDASGTPVCSSYLWATPREWAAIGQFALDGGVVDGVQLLPDGWMEQSTTPNEVDQAEDAGYGSSWWLNRTPTGDLVNDRLPADTYWMQGHDGQRVFVVPSHNMVVVRMGFSPTGPDLRMGEVLEELIGAVGS